MGGNLRGSASVHNTTGPHQIQVPGWLAPEVPEVWAKGYGTVLYTSVLFGQDMGTGNIVPGGVTNETNQIFKNLQQILTAAGAKMNDVVKTYAMFPNATSEGGDAFQDAYHTNFARPPLRYVQYADLPHGASVGLQFIIDTSGRGFTMIADPAEPTRQDVSFSASCGDSATLYTSGFVGYNSSVLGHPLVSDRVRPQFEQALLNVETGITLAGGSIRNATDCIIWTTNLSYLPEIKDVYTAHFQNEDYPALTIAEVAKMKKNAKVGVMCRNAGPGVQVERFAHPGAVSDGLPRSGATVLNGLVYTSGFYANQSSSGAAAETRNAMDQVQAALESAGSTMGSVIFCQVLVSNLADLPAIDAAYRTYFHQESLPARQVAQVVKPAPMAADAKVSISCIGSRE